MKYIFLIIVFKFTTNTLAQSDNLGNEVKLNMNSEVRSKFDNQFAEDLRNSIKKYIEKAKIKSKGNTNPESEIELNELMIGDIEHISPYRNNIKQNKK